MIHSASSSHHDRVVLAKWVARSIIYPLNMFISQICCHHFRTTICEHIFVTATQLVIFQNSRADRWGWNYFESKIKGCKMSWFQQSRAVHWAQKVPKTIYVGKLLQLPILKFLAFTLEKMQAIKWKLCSEITQFWHHLCRILYTVYLAQKCHSPKYGLSLKGSKV